MDDHYANEDFIAKWLAGELSEEELADFTASDVYRQLMAIDREAQKLSGPKIDVEKALAQVSQKNQQQQKEPKVKRLWWLSTAAAAVAILIVGYTYLFGEVTYSTGIGEKETVLLADGSMIELNANSTLSYKRFGWEEDRAVDFDGEGFFDIESGGDFIVNTQKGKISVLGTKFNVRLRKDLKVKCYEGSIVFTPHQNNLDQVNLTSGMEVELKDDRLQTTSFSADSPDWQMGYSSFTQQAFHEVLEELTLQYPVSFQLDSIQTERLFTGQFSHTNLENALKTTMEPMGIKYRISADKRIVTLSE
ncbi:FecR family protein [Allomuricauda sp. NBRC 101325]|uniref:FecR family protein n=1 Tax=Allomuricauda sp. NBRC 101325 TaxID=1113758 RepID=UPI0025569082|nr:FecR family protein [Muricauda sp. NBRC 101325]